ncbi:RHS repeat-associated core domain-containing protein [Bacteroides heparinolyticus]|uniref:RHS repeat-associated core domain-containing protein n=1 Tax=Prevotella heparinolytica TaxID=28113 RepID=UPI004039E6CE
MRVIAPPRDPETWSGGFAGRPKFDRGFTGHEHLYGFGLINMNGRMYDPVMSSFLSPDNCIQSPDFSQSFNRYSYCLNNPLKYVDPSGECIVTSILLGAYIGAYASLAINFVRINSDADFVNAWTLGALGGAVGAAAGIGAGAAMSSLVGDIGAIGGGLTGASSGFAGGFGSASTVAWCTGVSFGNGLSSGLKAGGWGALAGGVLGGLEGGYSAYSNGGNFWTGKGAAFDVIDSSVNPNESTTIDVGEGMEYSNEYAKEFSKMNFSDVKGVDYLYADGTVPKGYTKQGDMVFNTRGRSVGRTTIYNGFGKGSNVYLYKAAFQSPEQLYLTMGHEYLHCAYNYSGKSIAKYQDNGAYSWERGQAKIWKMSDVVAKCDYMIRTFYPTSEYSYTPSKFGFYSISIRPQLP